MTSNHAPFATRNAEKRRFAAIIGIVALVLGIAVPAAASERAEYDCTPPQLIEIVGNPDGFLAPSQILAGVTTFKVRTTNPSGSQIGLVKLNSGVSISTFLHHLEQVFSDDPQAIVEGGQAVVRDSTLYGGGEANHEKSTSFTIDLGPGRYYLISYQDLRDGKPAADIPASSLEVIEQRESGEAPVSTASIAMTADGRSLDYRAPAVLMSDRPVLITNETNHPEEAIFIPVRRGTTDADIQRFFEALDAGSWPPDAPFIGTSSGLLVISAHQSAIVDPDLTPGTYAVVSWIKDIYDASRHGARGMHAIVTVR